MFLRTRAWARKVILTRHPTKEDILARDLPALLSLSQVSRLLGVHVNTLRNWDRQGKLRAVRLGSRGDRRYTRESVLHLRTRLEKKSDLHVRVSRRSRVGDLLGYRHVLRVFRPVVSTVIVVVLVTTIGLSALVARAGQDGKATLRLLPSACTGWTGPEKALTIDRMSTAPADWFTADNSAIITSPPATASAEGVIEQPAVPPPTILDCGGFSLPAELPTDSMIDGAEVAFSYATDATSGNEDVLTFSYSTDGSAWETLTSHTFAPDEGNAERGGYDIYALTDLTPGQISTLQFRAEYHASEISTESIAHLDGLELSITLHEPAEGSTSERIHDSIENVKGDYTSHDTPELAVTISEGSWLGFLGVDATTRTLVDVQVVDPSGSTADAIFQEREEKAGRDVKKILELDTENFTRPGKYAFLTTIEEDGYIESVYTEFYWGVLAVNVRKSIGTPDTYTEIGMAVLDDLGATICDARLDVILQHPGGRLEQFTTTNKTVVTNPLCADKSFTMQPDYAAYFTTSTPGTYTVTVDAETSNGHHRIVDTFEVQDTPRFDVERTEFPTRIYPVEDYPVHFTVTPAEDFTGTLHEELPAALVPVEISDGGHHEYSTELGRRRVVWDVSWQKGKTYTIGYTFDAVDISPEYYRLGPLTFTSGETTVFQEARQWQIASDSVGSATATRLFTIGFEMQTPGGSGAASTASGGPAEYTLNTNAPLADTSTFRSGAASLETLVSGSAATESAMLRVGDANTVDDFYFRAYIRVATLPSTLIKVMMIENAAGTDLGSIRMNTNGTLELWNDEDTAQIGSDSSALATSTWYRLELRADCTSTCAGAGSAIVDARIDGVSFASATNVNWATGFRNFNWGIIEAATAEFNWDDIAVNNDSSINTAWPGDGSVVTIRPDGNGTNTAWTGTSADVDDTPGVDTTFANCTTTPQAEDYTLSNPTAITAGDNIRLAQVNVRQTSTGVNAHTYAIALFVGATDNDASGTISINQSTAFGVNDDVYTTTSVQAPTPPNVNAYDYVGAAATTNDPWTRTNLDSASVSLSTTDCTPNTRISEIWVNIEYVAREGGRLWTSGLELGIASPPAAPTAGMEITTLVNTPTVITSAKRSGSYSLRTAPSASTQGVGYTFATADTADDFYARAYVYFTTRPNANSPILVFRDNAGTNQASIRYDNTGNTLELWNEEDTAQIGSDSTLTISVNTWYMIELKIDATTIGSTVLGARLNGVEFATNTVNHANGVRELQFGVITTSATADIYWDDIAINQGIGATQNTYPGPGAVVHMQPNATGDNTAWNVSISCAAVDYTCLDEVPPNDVTDAVGSSTANQQEENNLETSASAGIGTNDTITLAAVGVRFNLSAAGTQGAIRVTLRDNTLEPLIESHSIPINSTTWTTNGVASANYPLTAYTRPSRTDAWTLSALDSTQIGLRLYTDPSTNNFQVSNEWLLVEYVPKILVQGNIYSAEPSTAYNCAGNTITVRTSTNGSTTERTGDCTLGTGAYSVTADAPMNIGETMTVFIDSGESIESTTVTLASSVSADITGLHLYQDRTSVGDEAGGTITNANLATADNGNTGIRYSVSSGNLTVESGAELHIITGDIFDPGGTVTTAGGGDLHLDDNSIAYLDTATSAIDGDITVDGGAFLTFTANTTIAGGAMVTTGNNAQIGYTGTPTVTITGTGNIGGGTNDGINLYNLTIGTATAATSTLASDMTVNNTLDIDTSDSLSINSGKTATHLGTTLTLDGTISGAGRLTYTSTTAFPNTGTISSILRFDATNGDQTMTARSSGYGGNVEIYTANVLTARTVTMTATATQAITGSLSVTADDGGDIILDASTNDPTVTISSGVSLGGIGGGNKWIYGGAGTWTVGGSFILTNGIWTHDAGQTVVMNGSGTFTTASNGMLNVTLSGTVTLANATHTISGNFSMAGGTITPGTSTINMTGTSNSIIGGGQTLNNLTINPSSAGTITLSTSDVTVGGTLNIAASDTLSLASSRTLTHTGATLTLTGTLTGTGLFKYQSASAFPTTGTLGSGLTLYFDTTATNQIMSARTDYPNVRVDNSGSTDGRTVTMGTAGGQTITMVGDFAMISTGTGTVELTGDANDPTVNITDQLRFISGGDTKTITTGSGTWTVTGNVDLRNGTFTASTNNTVLMNGASVALIGNSQSLYNLTIDGSTNTVLLATSDVTVAGTLNVATSDTLSLSSGRTLTWTGASFTLNGIISGAGKLLIDSSTTIPTTGTLSSVVEFYLRNGNTTTMPARTYGGNVIVQDGATSLDRTLTMGAGTHTLSANLDIHDNSNTGEVILSGTTNDPTVNISGNVTLNNGAASAQPTIHSGSAIWTVSGNADFLSNLGSAYQAETGNTLIMNGSTKTLTPSTSTFYNFTCSGTITAGANFSVSNTLLINSGTLTASEVFVGTTFTNNASFSHTASTLLMYGATGTIDGSSSSTFNNLRIDGTNSTVTVNTSATVNGVLTIGGAADSNNDTLSISSSKTVTSDTAGTVTFVNSGTDSISGAGILIVKNSNLDTDGTLSADVTFDASDGDITAPARTYGGDIITTSSHGISSRTVTLGSGTHTISGNLTSDVTGFSSTVSGSANNPTVNITGTLACSGFGDAANIVTGTGTWTVGGSVTLTFCSTFTATSGNTVNMNGSGTLTASGKTFHHLTLSGTVTIANFNHNVAGNLSLAGGTITPGTSTITMTGTSNTITGGSQSLNNLTINPSSAGTITLQTSDLNVGGTLNISASDALTINSGITLKHTGTTLTLTGTINGPGRLTYLSSTTFPTTGTLASGLILRMDVTSNSQVLSLRTDYLNVEVYSEHDLGGTRTVTLGTAGSQTIPITGYLTLSRIGLGAVAFEMDTHDPTTTITGTVTIGAGTTLSAPSATTLTMADSFANSGTFTNNSSTVKFSATDSGNTIASGGTTFNNINFDGVSGVWTTSDAMDVNGTFTVTNGTFTQGANVNLNVAGNFTLASGITFTQASGSGKVILDGDLTYTDNTSPKQSIGDVEIGTSPDTTNLATDFASRTLTVNAGDVFNTNGYEVDIGTGGITIIGTFDATDDVETDETFIYTGNKFDLRSGATFVQDQSTLTMDGGQGFDTTYDLITDGAFSLHNLVINDGDAFNMTIRVQDPLDVNNDLTITNGILDTVSGENNAITVGRNWTNNGGFTARSGVVNLDTTTAATIAGTTTFNDLSVTGIGAAKTITFTASTTQTVSGTWTVTGSAGNLITLQSSSGGSQWTINPTAASIDYVQVSDSNNTGAAICATHSTDTGNNNTNWTVTAGASCGATISGVIYTAEGSSPLNCGAGKTVDLRVNGGGTYTTECVSAVGAFSVTGITLASGNIVTLYLDDETQEGTTVYVSDGTNQTNVDIYQNWVIVRQDTGTGITNANLNTGDDGDDDIKYNVSGGNVTFDSGFSVHVWGGDTFAPGGTVLTQGGGHIHTTTGATFDAQNNAVTTNGDWKMEGTYTTTSGQLLTMNGTGTLTSGGQTLRHLTLSGAVTLTNATHTVSQDLSMAGGTITPGTSTVTMTGTSNTITGGGATLNNLTINPSSAGTITLSTSDLTVGGTLNIATGDTLSISASRTLLHSGATFTFDGTLTGSGRLTYQSNTAFPTSGTISNGILRFDSVNNNQTMSARTDYRTVEIDNSGTTAGRTVTAAAGTITIASTLTLQRSGSNPGTVTLELDTNDPTFTVGGSLTIGANTTLSANSANAFNFNGAIWTNNGTFTDNSGTVTFGGGTTQQINSAMTGSSDFNNLTITNASGSDPQSDPSVSFNASVSTAGTFTATTANTKLVFSHPSTFTFQNINLNGQATGTRVYLRSSSIGSQWDINVAGTRTVSNTDVRDSTACGQAPDIDATNGTNFDAGGNSCWLINTISISISDTAVGFGSLSSTAARWATADANGSAADTAAHTIAIATNARSGYALTYFGATLTSGARTIDAVTFTNDADGSQNTEQFALGLSTDGNATIAAAYDHNSTPANRDWSFVPSTTTQIVSESGSTTTETISAYYLANIGALTEPGTYTTNITYVLTSTF